MTAKDMEAPRRPMFLALSVEDPNGNDITCCSDTCPDSLRANSSLSPSSRTSSPANVKTVEDCINQVTSTGNVIKKVLVRADKTDMLNCVKTVSDNCNHDVAFMVLGLQNGNVYSEGTVPHVHDHITQRRDRGLETCLKSELQQTLDMRSCCASSGTCSSVSSEEMLIRSNSFTLHESDQVLSALDLQESSVVSPDVGLMPDLLPDVCEGLVSITNVSPDDRRQEFGITFIQTNNQTFIMEEDVFQTVPAPLGPLKSSGGSRYSHLIPGDVQYECTTPVDLKKSCAETLTPTHSTPPEEKTVHVPVSEELDISGNVKTSTPVQSLSSKTFCLPSLSDSPPKKDKSDLESPMAQVLKEQQTSAQHKSKTPLTTPSKSNKVEGKKFAKPDFSNIKSKIMSRSTSISKPSSVSGMKASSNITQQAQKNPIRKLSNFMQRKTPTKSSFSVSSNHTVTTCSSRKTEQNSVTKRTLSSTCQDGIPTSKSRTRTWSETSSSSKTAGEGLCVKELQVSKNLESFTNVKTSSVAGLKNLNALSRLSKEAQQVNGTHMWKKHQKTSVNTESSQPVEADWGRSSLCPQTSSSRTGGASGGQTPAVNPRPSPSASKLKHGTAGKNGCTTDMPSSRSKLNTSGGNLNMHLTEGTGAEGSRFTPAATQPPTPVSKLSVKPRPQLKSYSASSGHTKTDLETFSGGKHPSNKAALIRTRLQSLPPKAPKSGCKNTPQTSVKSAASVVKTPVTRPVRVANTSSVDKNKAKASLQTHQQGQRNGHPDLVPPETKPRELEYYKALCERKNQTIQQLKNSLLANNHRFEAITVVVQTLCTQHEEAVKRRRELSVELLNLREELVSSAQSRERLEKEKDELNVTFSGVLEKVQEQHRSDLTDLEERLKSFYSAEWEKVHQTYQDEADKYKAQIDQQLKALRAKHETIQKELEASHEREVKSIKQNYEESLEEIRKSHEQDMQVLEKTQKDMEATLSNQIEELSAVNHLLNNRLQEEQGRRRELAEKCQKDSHMLYLEQELESLKVVLDIKNKQIHQQDKKLLQLDKLIDKNVKLEECLTKVQQENEDLKARMDRHAALSRQLSTEQAVLQESLQKETKVNKRLSMENEELLWKLQNGDVSSPRKISPSSPSMTRQSPRHSGLFSSPPLSPR